MASKSVCAANLLATAPAGIYIRPDSAVAPLRLVSARLLMLDEIRLPGGDVLADVAGQGGGGEVVDLVGQPAIASVSKPEPEAASFSGPNL